MDEPKTANARDPRDCRDGTRPSNGAGRNPAGGLQSVPFETNRISTASTRTESLAATLENVADIFLNLIPRRSVAGIAFATGAITCLSGFLLTKTIRSPTKLNAN